ncbi:tRNA methyltransferase [Paragonimus heterotremus]|uniref:tRNA (adenine(58)-N(1))-methyltransferase catalytic subunit TRMT61A n=1 Tax=Paragonimus heterotremus TaxID=100268 RepID=A0A8J4WJ64_9TREM|nr:tRNA methyltransferase [Paragonimus heterotremus]
MFDVGLPSKYKASPFRKSVAAFGDCALIVTGKFEIRAITLTENGVTQTRYGALKHDDCIGKPYGARIDTSRGHVHILSLDPVLWSTSLPHRTQIIYAPDASLIVGCLDLVPGCRVFEAGTGSGSLTHFLAQAVWPTGHVHTFEFHAGRVECARVEFQAHSLTSIVSVTHRDVCSEGFPQLGEQDNPTGVNAVSLDLPQPWLVVPRLPGVFRSETGGRICSFSPCIEQVQRTCSALHLTGFVQMHTVECLQRAYDVSKTFLSVPNMGQVGADAPTASKATDHRSDVDGKWNKRFLLPPPAPTTARYLSKVDKDVQNGGESTLADQPIDEEENGGPSSGKKRMRLDSRNNKPATARDNARFTWEAVPQPVMAGHTGYLTFASWLPKPIPSRCDSRKCNPISDTVNLT